VKADQKGREVMIGFVVSLSSAGRALSRAGEYYFLLDDDLSPTTLSKENKIAWTLIKGKRGSGRIGELLLYSI